jgi:ribosomal protein L11 methylase PrmA
VDISSAAAGTFERLVDLGALDAEVLDASRVAALMPDTVTPAQIERALGIDGVAACPAVGRDDGSVWVLNVPPIGVGGHDIVLVDAPAFGTGLHPTTALCLDAIEAIVASARPEALLDVGTGSGVLAIAGLTLGVPRARGIDIDEAALRAAAENARRNGVGQQLELTRGGPDAVSGTWPLVVANVLAAPLVEMAPTLVRRIARRGQLVLSGIPGALEGEVGAAYRHLGMHLVSTTSRRGWVVLVLRASW